jgi:ABC-2 type transport system ATP-binding protein
MQALADDVVIVAAGRLVRQGTVAQVLASIGGANRVKVSTPEPEKLAAALLDAGAHISDGNPGDLMITGLDAARVGDLALAVGVPLHQLVTDQPDLEDVFLELTHAKAAIR